MLPDLFPLHSMPTSNKCKALSGKQRCVCEREGGMGETIFFNIFYSLIIVLAKCPIGHNKNTLLQP